MELGIRGKVALVIGASTGIGLAIARRLAYEGTQVALAARRAGLLEHEASALRRAGLDAVAIPADVTDMDQRTRLVGETRERLGPVEILVNNAGAGLWRPFAELGEADWARNMKLNLWSTVALCRLVLPDMIARGWGRIVNIAAIAAKEPKPGAMASNTSKAALLAFTKSLSQELAGQGITVNTICPGRIMSEQIEAKYPPGPERDAYIRAHIPVGRFGEPDELAALAAFLAADCAGYITGTAINVDGGMGTTLF